METQRASTRSWRGDCVLCRGDAHKERAVGGVRWDYEEACVLQEVLLGLLRQSCVEPERMHLLFCGVLGSECFGLCRSTGFLVWGLGFSNWLAAKAHVLPCRMPSQQRHHQINVQQGTVSQKAGSMQAGINICQICGHLYCSLGSTWPYDSVALYDGGQSPPIEVTARWPGVSSWLYVQG